MYGKSSASIAAPMRSPIVAPSAAPAPTCNKVMKTCTVARKLSGECASASAVLARRLVTARCLSRLLRATISAISLSAKKPLSSASTKTSGISSDIRAGGGRGSSQCSNRAAARPEAFCREKAFGRMRERERGLGAAARHGKVLEPALARDHQRHLAQREEAVEQREHEDQQDFERHPGR